jgi:hypothetical protein
MTHLRRKVMVSFKIPHLLLEINELNPIELSICVLIAKHLDTWGGVAKISVDQFVGQLKIGDVETAMDAIDNLVGKGIIWRSPTFHGRDDVLYNIYTFDQYFMDCVNADVG